MADREVGGTGSNVGPLGLASIDILGFTWLHWVAFGFTSIPLVSLTWIHLVSFRFA